MNQIYKFFVFGAALLMNTVPALSWGQKGHDVTCAIAERHLTPKAKREIVRIFDGQSIVYWANWMDSASHQKEYRYTSSWHYFDVDAGHTLADTPRNPNGDVLTAIDLQIAVLKNIKSTHAQKELALRMLVHLVGDLHCPMHLGHISDLGGNRWQVQFFGSGKNLHFVWDTGVLERAHDWGYNEWAEQIDIKGKDANAQIVSGTTTDWAMETLDVANAIYEATPVGSKLSYDYIYEWNAVAEKQLLRGGLRLARILNELFR